MRRERTGTWACADGQGCFTAGDLVTLSETIARDAAAPPWPRRPMGPPPRRQENDLAISQAFDPSKVLP